MEFCKFSNRIESWRRNNAWNPHHNIRCTPRYLILLCNQVDLRWSGSNDPSESGDARSFVPLYGLVITFAIFFLFEEVIEMMNEGKTYWKKGGNWVDLTYLALIFVSLILRVLSGKKFYVIHGLIAQTITGLLVTLQVMDVVIY